MLQFSISCCDFTTIVWIGLDLNARDAPDVLIKIFITVATAMAEKSPHILFKTLVPQQVTCCHFSSSHKDILSCALQDSPAKIPWFTGQSLLFGSCLSSVTLPSHPNLKVTNIYDRKNTTCKALLWVVTRTG